MELLWRPRRDKKRAAALICAEVALNTEILLLQAHAREVNPRGIPSDLRMSTIAWDAASGIVSELPHNTVRGLVQLYNKYRALNLHIEGFGEHLAALKKSAPGSKAYADAETMVARIIDVFNSGLDSTLSSGQEMLPELVTLAGIKETSEEKAKVPNYRDVALEHMAKRAAGTEAIKARDRNDILPPGSAA